MDNDQPIDSLGHRSPNWGEYPYDEATEQKGKGPDWDWTVYEGPSAHWYVIDGRATRIAIVRPDLPQERQERIVRLAAMAPQMRHALQAIVDKAGDLEEAQSMAQATLDYLETPRGETITVADITREDGFLCPECRNTGVIPNTLLPTSPPRLRPCQHPDCDAYELYHGGKTEMTDADLQSQRDVPPKSIVLLDTSPAHWNDIKIEAENKTPQFAFVEVHERGDTLRLTVTTQPPKIDDETVERLVDDVIGFAATACITQSVAPPPDTDREAIRIKLLASLATMGHTGPKPE